jgi:class 3 adenylate cyclase
LAGQTGLIAPTACPSLAPDVIKSCHCQLHAKNQSEVPGHTILQLDPQRSVPVQGPGPYFPIWQISSVDTSSASQLAMRDLNSIQVYHKAIEAMVQTQRNVISETSTVNETESLMFSPVYSATPATTSGDGVSRSHMIGAIVFKIVWDMFLDNIVPLGSEGIDVILENSCGQTHTFRSMGDYVVHVGVGEFYDPALESYKKQTSYEDYLLWQGLSSPYGNTHESPFNCAYRITLYPSNEYRSIWINNKPRVYAIVILMIFVFTCVVFVTYDCCVARRQRKVMHAALQRDEIVTSLFPDAVRGRLLKRGDEERCQETQPNRWNRLLRMSSNPLTAYRHRQRSISSSTTDEDDSDIQAISPLPGTDSIADYFPCVTVVFADISGFTAWSSEHDPSQVFHLLETVYHTFDKLARRYGVFKIETIGDCYVAVAGLPLHQPDHAIRVVMFAYECIVHMQCMLRDLQATLGPSTSELSIRIGIHSGPVIAGVLRGEKSRFQLFGDTMNTTSRVQTTGEINKIQISVATAKLLEEAKKSYWIEPRADLVAMKGKGLAQTYWVDLEELAAEVEGFDYSAAKYTRHDGLERWRNEKPQFLPPHPPNFKTEEPHLSAKNIFEALIESNTDMLMVYLRKVIGVTSTNPATSNLYDEVHAIDVPNGATKAMMPDNDFLAAVRSQLRDYIATIVAAGQSDDFPYHNFEHASYVARSAVGLIEGMVNTKFDCMNDGGSRSSLVEQPQLSFSGMERMVLQRSIHHKTFGISSDPLMQFALVLFAVINNFPFHPSDFIDAVAVTSTDDGMATCQHFQPNDSDIPKPKAIDFAWSFLTNGQEYQKLWHCICGTKQEQQVRFRQLLHRAAEASTMSANDRMKRWDNAVRSPYTEQEGAITVPSDGINNDLREVDQDTMLVFESVVQAAQLAHYMQEWDTFQYWQMHWLEECLLRRLDPSAGSSEEQDLLIRGLHERERLFFEQYAIPLAKDLGSCGRGFVSLLRLAEENQRKWEVGGMEMVHSILIGKESD